MKTFHFASGILGWFAPSSSRPSTTSTPATQEGLQRVTDFMRAISQNEFDRVRMMVTPDFRAHEPALNKTSTVEEMIYHWKMNQQLFVSQRFEIKKTATFSVFGDIDRDKYVYIKAHCHTIRIGTQQSKTIPFEMIARLDENRIAHILFCFGNNKAFEKLSSVQHARSLAHVC
jgi:limonene-1,2-epoxide hydrolase